MAGCLYRRHAEDKRESAKAMGFGKYVRELAYSPGAFDVRAGELSRDDREQYAKGQGRPWPKSDDPLDVDPFS